MRDRKFRGPSDELEQAQPSVDRNFRDEDYLAHINEKMRENTNITCESICAEMSTDCVSMCEEIKRELEYLKILQGVMNKQDFSTFSNKVKHMNRGQFQKELRSSFLVLFPRLVEEIMNHSISEGRRAFSLR